MSETKIGGLVVSAIVAVAIVGLVFANPSRAEARSTPDGYQRCNTNNIQACENSNQLFSGPLEGPHVVAKRDFVRALEHFLFGAPALHVGGYTFSASESAAEALVGPGDRHQFRGGELFFSGFTPHDAPDQAAVIFDARGKILMVATLFGQLADGHFKLTVYAHEAATRTDLTSYLEDWARKHVSGKSSYPGALPEEIFTGATLLSAEGKPAVWRATSIR